MQPPTCRTVYRKIAIILTERFPKQRRLGKALENEFELSEKANIKSTRKHISWIFQRTHTTETCILNTFTIVRKGGWSENFDTYLRSRCTVRSWAAPCRRGRWLGRRWSAPAAAPSASPGAGSTASGRCWRWESAPRGTRDPRRPPSGATTCCGNRRSHRRLRVHGKQKQHKNTCFSKKEQNEKT